MSDKGTMKNKIDEHRWEDAFEALCSTLQEDAANLEKLVADQDSSSAATDLRRERAAAFRYALSVADTLRRWDW